MEDFLTAKVYELWTIFAQGPLVPTKQIEQKEDVLKDPSKFVVADFRMMKKNAKSKKFTFVALVLISKIEYHNALMLSKFEMLFKLHIKERLKSRSP